MIFSREFAAEAAGVFEEGEEVGHAEEGAGGLIEVDQFEFAAAGAAVDVKSSESAEAGGVHVMDIFHVDDDALFGGEEIADFGTELWCVLGGELAVTFDDGGVLDAVGVDAEVGRGMVRVGFVFVRVGQGVAPIENEFGEIIAG